MQIFKTLVIKQKSPHINEEDLSFYTSFFLQINIDISLVSC